VHKVDVMINGGGMVGLALANLLPESVSVLVIDPFPSKSVDDCLTDLANQFDCRVSAISKKSQQILEKTQAWQAIPEQRITPYQNMNVWEANGSASLQFSAQQIAAENLGSIVENKLLRAALMQQANKRSGLTVMASKVTSFERTDSKVLAELETGDRIETSLMVGADGALSKTRDAFNFETSEQDYQQLALVANIETEYSHQFTAWQRFLTSGPIAYLPLPDTKQCSIVWSASQSLASELLALPEAQLQSRIAAALDYRLGKVRLLTQCQSFPLVARHSHQYLQPRVALIGDAAHTIHPLAGQGVNLGFADAAQLAEQISQLHRNNKDIGLLLNLRPFERARKADNHLTQKAMTALNWVYQQQHPAMVLARNLGVSTINNSPVLKNQLVKQAMGL